ncbi:hypothetical protein [Gemmatimonas sp.]|uniref:hypothetical protein n=1 Tax=Gemmatimonas sp. TaxID=1962908 RepID=UPI0035658C69
MVDPGALGTMTIAPPIDEWLTQAAPSVDEVAEQLRLVRRLAGDVSLAEAHLVSYVREKLDLGDLDDDPSLADPELAERDE